MADLQKYLDKADKQLKKGKPEAALEAYLEALALDASNEMVRQNAADLCITLGKDAQAAKLLSEIFDHQAETGDARAAANYKKLARVTTPTAEQTLRYARLIERTSKRDAKDAYRAAYDQLTKRKGALPQALEALHGLIAMDPSAELLRAAAALALEVGAKKQAAEYLVHLGEEASETNSAECFQRAYEADPTNLDAVLRHANSILMRGDAQRALGIIRQPAADPHASLELRTCLLHALIACKQLKEAAPIAWQMYESHPESYSTLIGEMIGAELDADDAEQAITMAKRLEEEEVRRGRRREVVQQLKGIADKYTPRAAFLEYMIEVFNAASRENEYAATLVRLFDIYFAGGVFLKACEMLDRAVEVDPYDEGHRRRLELLRGKADAARLNTIAGRMQSAGAVAESDPTIAAVEGAPSEMTVLEDFMLQAEIFLQYGMRSKAEERLLRLRKLFPEEEQVNSKLRELMVNAGVMPMPLVRQVAEELSPKGAVAAAAAAPVVVAHEEDAIDNFNRVTEITRNIYRQANVKNVLLTAVNETGRHFKVARCLAGLCAPGKPPSVALEYCAPGVPQSDVISIVKLLQSLQALCVERGTVAVPDALHANELLAVKQTLESLGTAALLAVPLLENEQHQGLLLVESATERTWSAADVSVLRTIGDQMMLAVNNAKLRSLMKTLAVTEEKSGLLKRSSYFDVLKSEAKRAAQQNTALSLLLLRFGNKTQRATEAQIQQIAQSLAAQLRQNDVAIRYDDSTVALVLPDTNDKNCFFVVEKLRKVFAQVKGEGGAPLPFTAGIAQALIVKGFEVPDIITEVINRVESALDGALADGGDRAHAAAMPEAAAAASISS